MRKSIVNLFLFPSVLKIKKLDNVIIHDILRGIIRIYFRYIVIGFNMERCFMINKWR
jgi:hypothetical protein